MQWVAKRWQGTRRLYLHAPPKNGLATAMAAMQGSVPAALTYLDLAWGRHDDAPTLCMLLTWMAARAERLQTLSLQAYTIHCLPPMLNLKHLVVRRTATFLTVHQLRLHQCPFHILFTIALNGAASLEISWFCQS